MTEQAPRVATAPFAAILKASFDAATTGLVDAGREGSPEYAYSLSDEEIHRRGALTLNAFIRALDGDPPTAYRDFWERLSYLRLKSGVKLDDIQKILLSCNKGVRRFLLNALQDEPRRQVEASEACAAIAEGAVLALYIAYEQAKDELIAAQQANIRQLSTPIIPVHAGVLVVPLIGTIDTARAGEMIERLLDGIVQSRAAVVIIDITGVAVVDTAVADHLVRASRAAELLGAKVVFVGISPATAQALVELGVDLGRIKTLAHLQAGIEVALAAQGLAIGPRGPGRAGRRP